MTDGFKEAETLLRGRAIRRRLICVIGVAAALLGPARAFAAETGKIAFVSNRTNFDYDVWVMDADGSNAVDLTLRTGFDSIPAWSPDGARLAFVRDGGIAVMNADGSNMHVIISRGTFPAWSPDGTKLAYSDFGGIAVANADGSNPVQLTTGSLDYRPSWSSDGTKIVYDAWASFANQTRALFVMNSDGSNAAQLTPDAVDSTGARFSPDGKTIVFRRGNTCCSFPAAAGGIALINADGSGLKQLTPVGSWDDDPSWASDAKAIVFDRQVTSGNTEVFTMSGSGSNVTQLTSSPFRDELPVWQPVARDTTPPTATAALTWLADTGRGGGARYSVDVTCWDAVGVVSQVATVNGISVQDGQLLSLKVAGGPQRTKTLQDGTLQIAAPAFKLELACSDDAGNAQRAIAVPGPLGRLLFISTRSGSREIYSMNRDGSGIRRLTFNDIFERNAKWSPDGTKIVFSGQVDGNFDIYMVAADGSGLRRLTTDPGRDDDPAWTTDGKGIVYDSGLFGCPCSLRLVNADGSNDHALNIGPGDSFSPEVSPSGTSIAFANNRAGTFAIYVAPLAGGVARAITSGSVGGDFQPRWAPSGQDVLFLRDVGANDNDLYTVGATGANLRRLTNTPTRAEFSATWSPTGQEIVFFTGEGHLYSIRSDGSEESQLESVPQAPFVETFGRDGPIDASMFHTIANPGGSILASRGQLLASVFHDADPSTQNFNQIDEHIGTQCTLNGDFDIQVDYSLVTWPPHNGFFAMLNGIFADGAVARVSTQFDAPDDESYNGWSSGPPFTFGQVNTTDQSGQMRLVRQAGVLYEYERNGPSASWMLVHIGGPATGNAVAAIGLWAPGNSWTHVDGTVAYDNFRFNSGGFTCPNWWSDSWPDWARPQTDG